MNEEVDPNQSIKEMLSKRYEQEKINSMRKQTDAGKNDYYAWAQSIGDAQSAMRSYCSEQGLDLTLLDDDFDSDNRSIVQV